MLPFFRNRIKPWFAQYGATLDCKRTFRIHIDMVRKEIDGLKAIMPAYKEAGFDDILADCERDIAEAEEIISLMEQRLAQLQGK